MLPAMPAMPAMTAPYRAAYRAVGRLLPLLAAVACGGADPGAGAWGAGHPAGPVGATAGAPGGGAGADDRVQVVYFSETLAGHAGPRPAPDVIRLAAAVAWRRVPGTPLLARRGRGPVAWLRRARHQLWLRLGPLGSDLHLRGTGPPRPPRLPGAVSRAGVGPDDVQAVYHDEGARAVRLLDRVYPLPPDGRTLVLLLAEGRGVDAPPRVTVRTVPAPVIPAPVFPGPPDPAFDGAGPASRRVYLLGGEDATWRTALRADPVVRAFLDGPAHP
jgi:hypothetical protein